MSWKDSLGTETLELDLHSDTTFAVLGPSPRHVTSEGIVSAGEMLFSLVPGGVLEVVGKSRNLKPA